jgi:hypothetical protein
MCIRHFVPLEISADQSTSNWPWIGGRGVKTGSNSAVIQIRATSYIPMIHIPRPNIGTNPYERSSQCPDHRFLLLLAEL